MGIGSITSTNSISGMQMLKSVSTDPKIKKIENEITNAKQQMQKLSPKGELSDNEKETERKKLQKEISSLNTKLLQHQDELRKSQKKEIRMEELREDQKLPKEETSSDKADEKALPTDKQQTMSPGTVITSNSDGTVMFKGNMNQDEKHSIDTGKKQTDETKEKDIAEKKTKNINSDTVTETNLSHKKIYAIVSADSSVQQASRQGAVIANTRDGIAILKGEMNQDEQRGVDTEKKQTELEKMEKKEQRAIAFQASILGEANNTMKSAAETNVTGTNDKAQVNAQNNAFRVAWGETQTAQQKFHIAFG
ncbi:MAG: hypothetical protein HDR11_17040 [Lachnospiraceae bacterium]|nr:hypothetical protein [Lachnospiraceae bacterium]